MSSKTIELDGRKIRVHQDRGTAVAEVVEPLSEAEKVFEALEAKDGVYTHISESKGTYVAYVDENENVPKITSEIDTRKRDIEIKRVESQGSSGGSGLYVTWQVE